MDFFLNAAFFQFTVTQVFLISVMIRLGEVMKWNPKIPVVPKNQNWKNLELRLFTVVRQSFIRSILFASVDAIQMMQFYRAEKSQSVIQH